MKMRHVVFALVALLTYSSGWAVDTKISALPAASTPLVGTEVVPIVQSGATVKATITDIRGAGAPAVSVFKAADTSRASNSTRSADPNLAFASLVAGTYKIEGVLYFQNATGGIDCSFALVSGTAPTSGRVSWVTSDSGTIIVANSGNTLITTGTGAAQNGPLSGGNLASNVVSFAGWVTLPSTTSLTIFWAQGSSNVSATILKQGSWMTVQAM